MSQDSQRKRRELEKGDHMSDVTMLLKLSREYDESLSDFSDLEGKFTEQNIDNILEGKPVEIHTQGREGQDIKTYRTYDDYLNAAEIATYSSDDTADFILVDAIRFLRSIISEIQRKPWIRAEKPEEVTEILCKAIQAFQNALMRAERSHVKFGKSRFAQAVETLSNKRTIPVDSKVMAVVHSTSEDADSDYDESDDGAAG